MSLLLGCAAAAADDDNCCSRCWRGAADAGTGASSSVLMLVLLQVHVYTNAIRKQTCSLVVVFGDTFLLCCFVGPCLPRIDACGQTPQWCKIIKYIGGSLLTPLFFSPLDRFLFIVYSSHSLSSSAICTLYRSFLLTRNLGHRRYYPPSLPPSI